MYCIGSIIGDIVGSVYEFNNIKTKDFELFNPACNFTDDSIMTIATVDWLLNGGDISRYYQEYGREYKCPKGGYGGNFSRWIMEENPKPYGSWGNGSAMRVSPVGWFCSTLEDTLQKAKESAAITHDHIEGIKGAQAVAASIFLLRKGATKKELKSFIEEYFEYDLSRTCDEIRPTYKFDVSCQGTVPEAIIAFLESSSFEDAIRNAVSLGGDCDTLTCICGAIAEAFYGVPHSIEEKAVRFLPKSFVRLLIDFQEVVDFISPKDGEVVEKQSLHKEMIDICEWDDNKPIIPCLVDFDGTIVKHKYPNIGEPVPNALYYMCKYSTTYNVGWILDTMRSGKLLDEAVKYLTDNGIKLYGVGKHPTQHTWTNSEKAYGVLRWDDNNAGVPKVYEDGERPYLDWDAIDKDVRPLLQSMSGNYDEDDEEED